MNIHVHHYHHHDGGSQLANVLNQLAKLNEVMMTVSPQVQSLLDLAKQNTTVVASMDAGFKALQQQVAQLQQQIASGTPSLSDDDKAALTEATTDLQNSVNTLQSDIPANTSIANPPPAGSTPGTAAAS